MKQTYVLDLGGDGRVAVVAEPHYDGEQGVERHSAVALRRLAVLHFQKALLFLDLAGNH